MKWILGLGLCLTLASATAAAELDTFDVFRQRQSTVVKLFGAGVGNLDSYGSGVLISAEGHVATVWNHLINTGYLTAVTFDGRRYDVEVVGTSQADDLAILKLQAGESESFPFIEWNNTSRAQTGDSVLAFSNVYHVATGNEPVSLMHGVIAAVTPVEAGHGRWELPLKKPVYLIDAITNNSGAAGGLLTTAAGEPLAMLGREVRERSTDMWINYAVPWPDLAPAIQTILSGRRVERPTADSNVARGLSARELTMRFGLTLLPAVLDRTPAFVDAIVPDSAAAQAGLRRGDLVLLVDDDVIQSIDDVRRSLATRRPGLNVTITYRRDGQVQSGTLKIPQPLAR